MIRIPAAIALALAVSDMADAQIIIRNGRPTSPRPLGVIQPPSLPLPGSPLQHNIIATPRPAPRPYLLINPYYHLGGYVPVLPGWYEPTPTIVNNYIPIPAPAAPTSPPPPPPELKARLTLNVPAGANVWLGGKEVDAAVTPIVLESPVLQEGQSYAFDVKVAWIEGRDRQERARKVIVEAGESKSLTYTAAR